MAKARAADAAGVLLDELLLDIFGRVPDVLDLIRCAGTCTRWFRLICCPEFLRRIGLLTENARHRSFLIGAFWQRVGLISAPEPMARVSNSPPRFFSSLDTQPAGDAPLTFTLFIPNNDGLFNYALPLVSRHGLLLVRIMPTPLDKRKLHLAVCHPLAGERSTRLVPPPPLELDPNYFGGKVTGYALLTAADKPIGTDLDHQQRIAFQVLFTIVHLADQLTYVYSYSSATGSWNAPIQCSQTSALTMSGPRTGVVTGDMVHWLYRDETSFCILNVSASTRHVSLTKIPIQVRPGLPRQRPPFPCVAEDGKLSFINQLDNGVLELWTKRDLGNDPSHDCDREWMISELISEEAKGIHFVYFAKSRGAIIVTQPNRRALFSLDLENKKTEPLLREGGSRFYEEYDGDHRLETHRPCALHDGLAVVPSSTLRCNKVRWTHMQDFRVY